MSDIQVLIQKKSKTIIIQADQFDQNDYSLNIADDNTVEVYNTHTNQLLKKVNIPFGTSNIGRVIFARFKNNIYAKKNFVDFKPLNKHGNQYVTKDYAKTLSQTSSQFNLSGNCLYVKQYNDANHYTAQFTDDGVLQITNLKTGAILKEYPANEAEKIDLIEFHKHIGHAIDKANSYRLTCTPVIFGGDYSANGQEYWNTLRFTKEALFPQHNNLLNDNTPSDKYIFISKHSDQKIVKVNNPGYVTYIYDEGNAKIEREYQIFSHAVIINKAGINTYNLFENPKHSTNVYLDDSASELDRVNLYNLDSQAAHDLNAYRTSGKGDRSSMLTCGKIHLLQSTNNKLFSITSYVLGDQNNKRQESIINSIVDYDDPQKSTSFHNFYQSLSYDEEFYQRRAKYFLPKLKQQNNQPSQAIHMKEFIGLFLKSYDEQRVFHKEDSILDIQISKKKIIDTTPSYEEIHKKNAFSITKLPQFDHTENELKQNMIYRYINFNAVSEDSKILIDNKSLSELGFFDETLESAYKDKMLFVPQDDLMNTFSQKTTDYNSTKLGNMPSWTSSIVSVQATIGQDKAIKAYGFEEKKDSNHLSQIDISLSDYHDIYVDSGSIDLEDLFETNRIEKLFPYAKYAVLHDLHRDQAYFASVTKEKEFIQQAFPIQTERKHILGNVKLTFDQQIGFALPENKHNLATHLASLHVFNDENEYIGKIHLTK